MTKEDIIRMAREAGAYPAANTDRALLLLSESHLERFAALVAAAERERLAQPEQAPNKEGSPCPEFWDWLPKAYNFDGNGAFTKYNMEVAFLAGKQTSQPAQQEPVCAHGIGKTKCSFCHQPQPEQEPVAHTLNCVCGAVWDIKADGVEEMVHAPNPPQRKPLTDEEIEDIWADCPADWDDKINVLTLARAIEAAHGIKGEA